MSLFVKNAFLIFYFSFGLFLRIIRTSNILVSNTNDFNGEKMYNLTQNIENFVKIEKCFFLFLFYHISQKYQHLNDGLNFFNHYINIFAFPI